MRKKISKTGSFSCYNRRSKSNKIAHDHGIDYIERPADLSSDSTLMPEVITHALSHYSEPWDAVMVLQPTCPLRKTEDIDDAILLMDERRQNL